MNLDMNLRNLKTNNMSFSNLKWYIVILLLILILGFLIFLTFKNQQDKTSAQKAIADDFAVFDSVDASINGKIINMGNGRITVENQKGSKLEATLTQNIIINDLSVKEPLGPTDDPKNIKLNQPAEMIFKIQDGKYTVTAITFPPF